VSSLCVGPRGVVAFASGAKVNDVVVLGVWWFLFSWVGRCGGRVRLTGWLLILSVSPGSMVPPVE